MGKDYSVLCVLKYIYIIKKNYKHSPSSQCMVQCMISRLLLKMDITVPHPKCQHNYP